MYWRTTTYPDLWNVDEINKVGTSTFNFTYFEGFVFVFVLLFSKVYHVHSKICKLQVDIWWIFIKWTLIYPHNQIKIKGINPPLPLVIPITPVLEFYEISGLLLFGKIMFKKLCFGSMNIPLLNIKYTKQFIQRNQFKIYTEHFQCPSCGKAGVPYNNSTRQVLPWLHSETMAFKQVSK